MSTTPAGRPATTWPDVERMALALREFLEACGASAGTGAGAGAGLGAGTGPSAGADAGAHPDADAGATPDSACLHPDLAGTPERVAQMWITEILDGYTMDPAQILGAPVSGESDPEIVVLSGLRFHSMCPHHLFAYQGTACIGYQPAGKLAGFSRVAQLVDCFAHRLTLQERIATQVAQALVDHLGARGAGCVLNARQLCLALPGDQHPHSRVTTAAFVGEMQGRPDLQRRLLRMAAGRRRRR